MERAGRFVYILSLWYTSDEISILMHALYRDFLRQCSVHQNGRLAKHTKTKKGEALEKIVLTEDLIVFVRFLLLNFFHKICPGDFSEIIRPISKIFSGMITGRQKAVGYMI